MSKEITRTINTSEITCNAYHMIAKEMVTVTLVISGKHMERDKEVEKEIKRVEKENKEIKILDIVKVNIVSDLYAMDESDFVRYAHRIGDGR